MSTMFQTDPCGIAFRGQSCLMPLEKSFCSSRASATYSLGYVSFDVGNLL